MLNVLRRRWFLLLLLATLTIGIYGAQPLETLANSLPRNGIVGSVLFAMALPLRTDAIGATISRPAPALLAVAINFVVVPLLAWGASLLLDGDLALGLIIAAAVPCTLASAAVWTRLAGGNDATSLLVTMLTNLSCFLVTPALIELIAGRANDAIHFTDMAQHLFVLIVLPIAAAQLLRCVPRIGNWATINKPALSVCAQLGLLSIVFVGAVSCGLTIAQFESQLTKIAGQLTLMLFLVAIVHTAALWIGYQAATRAGMRREEQLAVAFSGSQKTLMVGLVIALPFGGLTVLPMLAYHVEQLVIDTLIADWFHAQTTPREA